MRWRLATAALLGTFVLVTGGCGAPGSETVAISGDPISFQALSRSARTSAHATSGRFAFAMELALPGGSQDGLSFSGEGAFDKGSGRARLAVDLSAFAELLGGFFDDLGGARAADAPDFDDPSAWRIEVVQDGPVGYLRFPAISSKLPSGKTWVRTDGASPKVGGVDLGRLEPFAGSDPRELLQLLEAARGEVETIGAEELHGVQTTHYRVTVDASGVASLGSSGGRDLGTVVDQLAALAAVGEIPVDVWLDASGLVRKLELAFSAAAPGTSGEASASLSFELWDYGKDVEIALPPAGELAEASALE